MIADAGQLQPGEPIFSQRGVERVEHRGYSLGAGHQNAPNQKIRLQRGGIYSEGGSRANARREKHGKPVLRASFIGPRAYLPLNGPPGVA